MHGHTCACMFQQQQHGNCSVRAINSSVPAHRVSSPLKQSILEAMEHLLAKYREILPLFFVPALPMKDEWKIKPYLGVFPFVFSALRENVCVRVEWCHKVIETNT